MTLKYLKYSNYLMFASTGLFLIKIGKAPFALMLLPFFLLFFYYLNSNNYIKLFISALKSCDKFFYYVIGALLCSFIFNINDSKVTSILYITFWIFIYINNLFIYKNFNQLDTDKLFKIILIYNVLYVLFGVMLRQVSSNGDLLNNFLVYDFEGVPRPRGITTEPSYSSFVVSICFASLLKINPNGVRVKWLVIYLLNIFLLESAYGYIFFAIVIILYYKNNRFEAKYLPLFVLLSLLVTLIIINNDIYFSLVPIKRALDTISILIFDGGDFSSKIENVRNIDASAFFRIGPTLIYFNKIDFLNLHFYFGNGAGLSGSYFGNIFYDYLQGEDLDLGLIPAFLYDYGLVCTVLVLVFVYKIIRGLGWEFYLLFGLFMFNASFSTQIFWFIIITITLLKNRNNKLNSTSTSMNFASIEQLQTLSK